MAEVLTFSDKTLFNDKVEMRLKYFKCHAFTNALDVSSILWKLSECASYSFKNLKLTKTSLQIAFYFSFLLLCFSATAQKADSTTFFDKLNFFKDTLYIKARFMVCVEWGGHLELTKVFLKGEDFHLKYQKFMADCSKVKENNGEPTQTLEKTVERPVTEKDKQLIKQYACSLVVAKFSEPPIDHAGYIFELKNMEETLNIYVYTWRRTTRDEYLDFIARLLN